MSLFRSRVHLDGNLKPFLGIYVHATLHVNYSNIEAATKMTILNFEALVIVVKGLITLVLDLNFGFV